MTEFGCRMMDGWGGMEWAGWGETLLLEGFRIVDMD